MRKRAVLVWLIGCSGGGEPESSHKARTVVADTGSGDTGSGEGPSACADPSLSLVQQFEHLEFVDAEAFSPPSALGSCGWGMAAVDLNGDGAVDLLPLGHSDATFALINVDGVLVPSDEVRFDGDSLPAANGVGAGDLNGDGRPDLVLLRSSGLNDLVYMNQGGGQFESASLPMSSEESQDATFFDADLDGDLDVFVSRHIDLWDTHPPSIAAGLVRGANNTLYINEGGVLSPAEAVGTPDAASFQAIPLDVDRDGDLDLYLVNDFGMFIAPNQLLLNDGHGGFTEAPDCSCDLQMFGMGGSASDFNNDGAVDLHITDFGSPRTLMGLGDGTFVNATAAAGALISPSSERVTSWGTAYVDLDQDGWDDMMTVFGPVLMGIEGDWANSVDHPSVNELDDSPEQRNAFFRNARGTFEDQSSAAGFDHLGASRAVVTADFNADGIPDIAISGVDAEMRQEVRVYHGQGGCGPGITIDFTGRDAASVGTTVEWSVGDQQYTRWYQPGTTYSVSGPTLHLGLGGRLEADYVRITPTGGETLELNNVVAGDRIMPSTAR